MPDMARRMVVVYRRQHCPCMVLAHTSAEQHWPTQAPMGVWLLATTPIWPPHNTLAC